MLSQPELWSPCCPGIESEKLSGLDSAISNLGKREMIFSKCVFVSHQRKNYEDERDQEAPEADVLWTDLG